MGITVNELLLKPFLSRTRDDMLRIVAESKPRPLLNKAAVVTMNDTDNSDLQTHRFNPVMYEEVSWLTGCENRNKFFCWPCLLFMPDGMWSAKGISDFAYIIEGMSKHEKTADHIDAVSKLQQMVTLNVSSPTYSNRHHFESVKRNRAIIKRMADVVCNLFMKEQPLYKRKNGCQITPDNCVKNLQFLKNYDVLNCSYVEDAIDLINMTPDIINNLVDTISKVVKLGIRKEILSSTYVSLILSDHSEIASRSQVSTVLRYLKDENICERFIGFGNMGNLKYPSVVHEHVSNVIAEFELSEKLIAVSLDGGVLSSDELSELISTMLNLYPFVPWYDHGLDYALQQSLSNIKDCGLFFKTINEMNIYFKKKSKQYKALEMFMLLHCPAIKNTKWFVRSQIISIVNSYRKYFILFFESVIQNSNNWDAEDVTKVLGFQRILEEFKIVFLLQTFSKLFQYTSTLNKILKSDTPESIFNRSAASQLSEDLVKERDNGFDELWTKVDFETCIEPLGLQPKKLKIEVDDSKIDKYRELYTLIFNRVIQEIDIRFNDLKRLDFCHLLNCDQYVNFTNQMLQQLMTLHGAYFDEEQVRNELIVLRTNAAAFSNKSVYDFQRFLVKSNLKNTFKAIYKLTQFLLTLPIKPTDKDTKVSKLQDITCWSYVPAETGLTSGDISIPCVELDFLQDLKKSDTFYDDVIANFYGMNKTLELLT